jgi:hypothetical protein
VNALGETSLRSAVRIFSLVTDALLRRIEFTACVICGAFAAIALVIARGRPGPALAVIAGGILVAVSYYTITSATSVMLAATAADADAARVRRRFAWTLTRIALRYALLTFLAYVMIARLRLHPLGLLAGASSVVAAVSVEALRLLLKKS